MTVPSLPPAQRMREIWTLAFTPPDRRPIYTWAAENITLPPVLTRRGAFSVEGSRHFIGPLDAIHSARVREVNILKPVRGGGTLIADIAVPWAIAHDHASVLWVFQNDDIAREHAEMRQWPILKSVPPIAAMLPENRNKQRTQEIIFANGLPLMLQGPAIGGLQSKGFKWVICDEPWLYKAGILAQAKGRLGDFAKLAAEKFLAISQGGEEESDWDFQCQSGELLPWHIRCAGCGEHIRPRWTDKRDNDTRAGVVFDSVKYPNGEYDIDATARTTRFVCHRCGHEHPDTESTRAAWDRSGEYRHADGALLTEWPERCTFHWWSIVDWPMSKLVSLWLAAQKAKRVGNLAPLVSFCQKQLAEMRSERTVHDVDLPFARKPIVLASPLEKAWPDEAERFLTADRQSEDTYWVIIRAWAVTGESRRLWFGRCYSEADIEAKRIEFGIEPACTVVDSGYLPKGDTGVYAACIRYGWIAAKGEDDAFFWHIIRRANRPAQRVRKPWAPVTRGDPGIGTKEQGRTSCPLVRFSSPTCKDRVIGLINTGRWVEPETGNDDELEREYRAQMSGEYKRPMTNKRTGRRELVWYCPGGNNHALDCSAMQVLCAMQSGMIPLDIDTAPPPTEATPLSENP